MLLSRIENENGVMMNNLSDTHFLLKHQTLPFLGTTLLPSEGRQQTY
jgi:hypothetical protein